MTAPVASPPQVSVDQIGGRCLVTGGAGYLGSQLVQRLVDVGCQVRSLDIAPQPARPGVEAVQADLCDRQALATACEGVDTVFHTAAIINICTLARPAVRRQVWRVNVEGTQHLLQAAANAGVAAFVHTSTGNVAMDRELIDVDETTPYATRTRDLYSVSKIAAERLALAADQADGMRVCALRSGGLWGPDARSVMVRSFLDELRSGRFVAVIGDGRTYMDNTHIENLLDAQLLAAKALRFQAETSGGQAYFVFDGERINPMEWFRPLTEGLGYRFPRVRLPGRPMLWMAWGLELAHLLGARQPTLTVRAVRNLLESSAFRIDKACRELGYAPRYSRDSGLPELLAAARVYLGQKRSGEQT